MRLVTTRRVLVLPLLAIGLGLAVACGGGDGSGGAVEPGSIEARVVSLEGKMANFEAYVVAQAQLQAEQAAAGGPAGTESEITYSLGKVNASENEQEIVRWMAECSANSYLNPDLPQQVIDREIDKAEAELWDSLEVGQYSSFEQFIGLGFRFCQATLVEDN